MALDTTTRLTSADLRMLAGYLKRHGAEPPLIQMVCEAARAQKPDTTQDLIALADLFLSQLGPESPL